MDNQEANSLLGFLDGNSIVQGYIAQAKSRYILLNVEEPIENFPAYVADLSDRNNHTAFSYLTIGCYFAEMEDLESATNPLKTGASLLEYNHKPLNNRIENSKYYILSSSLAYYAAFEYSKAFIMLNEVEYETVAGNILSLFLKKKFDRLLLSINEILLDSSYSPDNYTYDSESIYEDNLKIYNYLLAKSIANLLEFFYSGDEENLLICKEILNDLLELLSADEEPSMWWSIRLFRIIVNGFDQSSTWKILPPLFPRHLALETSRFIKTLSLRNPVPIVELFISQRDAVKRALSPEGLVVCLPTSGGKTRVAEISIFQVLISDLESIVLYIAPFRSLAFEVEQALELTFNSLGIKVSHLYGGNQFSKIDKLQLEDSRILIATPEKAKALFRADESIANKIKLVILDEGHLLGNSERLIRNEMFFEELRYHIESNRGKFIVLSAVLPNANVIAEWVATKSENVYSNSWKPSTRRLGILEFSGYNVNINWIHEEPETWNYKFVSHTKDDQGAIVFPVTKRQAVAATAVKLSTNGSVLIFQAKSTVILAQAADCLIAMGDSIKPHQWKNPNVWNAFELAAKQSLGKDSDILRYAKYGILCHYRKLPSDVKICLERLMRQSDPKIIISTTTLAQGVNLGVSTVIIADIWFEGPGGPKLSISSFWNIVGRAGRAFVDSEGKILIAIELSRIGARSRLERASAMEYLTSEIHDDAKSGILQMIVNLESIANKYKIEFELLLELIAENYSDVDTQITEDEFHELQNKLDLIDDTLLSLNDKKSSWLDKDPSSWVDAFFRKSLAYIQALNSEKYHEEALIRYFKKRNQILLEKVGSHENWKEHITTGIPLRASLKLKELLPSFERLYSNYLEDDSSLTSKIAILLEIVTLIHSLPGADFIKKNKISNSVITDNDRQKVKTLWLSGIPFVEIENAVGKSKANYFCNDYFNFVIPWVLNAIARKFNKFGTEDICEFYENLAIEVEIGVPSVLASKVFLAGFRSRTVATEISGLIDPSFAALNINELLIAIIELEENSNYDFSEEAKSWIGILKKDIEHSLINKVIFPPFSLRDELTTKKLVARKFEEDTYLCSPDYSEQVNIAISSEFPFDEVANIPGISFEFDENEMVWNIQYNT